MGPGKEALLACKSRDVGLSGLVNALYQSSLTYVKAQVEHTAMAAAGATNARVFVNNRPIDEVLSPT